RKPKALAVIALLDRRSEDALDADPVTAHNRRYLFAGLIEDPRSHRFRVLVAQLEDVSDLDRPGHYHRRPAIRTSLSGLNVAHVFVLFYREIAPGRDITQVVVLLVSSRNQIGAAFERLVDHDLQTVHAHRTKVSGGRLVGVLDFFCMHRAHLAGTKHGKKFRLVQHVVAAYEHRNRTVQLLALLVVEGPDQR